MLDRFGPLSDWLLATLGLGIETQRKLFVTLAVVVILAVVRWLVLAFAWRRVREVQSRYWWRKSTTYVTVAVGLVLVVQTWFTGVQDLLTFVGLLSAGLAIALKDLIANLVGWAFILWRRPFEIDDRVEVAGYRGDVIDIRLFQFSLLEIGQWVDADQSTGRIVHVPNGHVFTSALANYTKGFKHIWNEIPVVITFESNWQGAKTLLEGIATAHGGAVTDEADSALARASRTFSITRPELAPRVYTTVVDHGVMLTIRYLTDPRRRRDSTQAIWEDILSGFSQRDDVDFAYPTTRFYDNPIEGKPEARAPKS